MNKSSNHKDEIEYDQHVDFYYANMINSIILYTYNSSKLNEMTPILVDPLTELYEELDYAFTPVCFETIFRVGRINHSFKNELLAFKKEVDKIPTEFWKWEFLDHHEKWIMIREQANILLDKLGVLHRNYNDDNMIIYDNEGHVIIKGKNCP
jgi:hypothetical protein